MLTIFHRREKPDCYRNCVTDYKHFRVYDDDGCKLAHNNHIQEYLNSNQYNDDFFFYYAKQY